MKSLLATALVALTYSGTVLAVPVVEDRAAANVCGTGIYRELSDLQNYSPAVAFCRAIFPVKCAAASQPKVRRQTTVITTSTRAAITTTTAGSSTTRAADPRVIMWNKLRTQAIGVVSTLCSCIQNPKPCSTTTSTSKSPSTSTTTTKPTTTTTTTTTPTTNTTTTKPTTTTTTTTTTPTTTTTTTTTPTTTTTTTTTPTTTTTTPTVCNTCAQQTLIGTTSTKTRTFTQYAAACYSARRPQMTLGGNWQVPISTPACEAAQYCADQMSDSPFNGATVGFAMYKQIDGSTGEVSPYWFCLSGVITNGAPSPDRYIPEFYEYRQP